jgi:hypothetical protein
MQTINKQKTYANHINGTPHGTNKTSTENKESTINKQLVSRTTKEQKLIGI